MSEIIENKVANSGLVTLDLEEVLNFVNKTEPIDLKEFLFQGLILKEKDFRTALKEKDWSMYKDSLVAIYCSADAIIPSWAFMLLASYLQNKCIFYAVCQPEMILENYLLRQLEHLDLTDYKDKRAVVKGCGKQTISHAIYTKITSLLLPITKSIMYGEPCSTVPIFKQMTK